MPTGVTGLLDPNGAGKSTLIKILLGLLQATSGKGSVLGMPLWRSSREIRQLVGYMPEDDCCLPSLSGVECVQFAARLNCIPAVEALRRSHEILDFCGVGRVLLVIHVNFRPVGVLAVRSCSHILQQCL